MTNSTCYAARRAPRPLSRGGLLVWLLAILLSAAALILSGGAPSGRQARAPGDPHPALIHAPPQHVALAVRPVSASRPALISH